MPNPRIEIKSTGGTYTELFIDWHPIHGVKSMKF